MHRSHLGKPPKHVDEVPGFEALAGRGHEHDERLSGVPALANDEVAEVPRARRLVVRLQPLLARPAANGKPNRVADIGRQQALLDSDDLVPASGAVEPEVESVLGRREGVLELVAVSELGGRRHDRLERRLREAADAHESVAYLALLLRDLHVVREILEATAAANAEVPAWGVDA